MNNFAASKQSLFLALISAAVLLSTAPSSEAAAKAPWVGKRLDGKVCAGGQPTSGPFDYLFRSKHEGSLRVVEEHHFDKGVETLTKGLSTTPMGDIDFVLKAFPNHHRALQSAMTYSLRHKKWPAGVKELPVECYLQRAAKYSPRDAVVHRLLGYYMHKRGNLDMALKHNKRALDLQPFDIMTQYNTGLILADLERYKQAKQYAQPLYDAGLTLPGLKNKLIAAGHWKKEEPTNPETDVAENKTATAANTSSDSDNAQEADEDVAKPAPTEEEIEQYKAYMIAKAEQKKKSGEATKSQPNSKTKAKAKKTKSADAIDKAPPTEEEVEQYKAALRAKAQHNKKSAEEGDADEASKPAPTDEEIEQYKAALRAKAQQNKKPAEEGGTGEVSKPAPTDEEIEQYKAALRAKAQNSKSSPKQTEEAVTAEPKKMAKKNKEAKKTPTAEEIEQYKMHLKELAAKNAAAKAKE